MADGRPGAAGRAAGDGRGVGPAAVRRALHRFADGSSGAGRSTRRSTDPALGSRRHSGGSSGPRPGRAGWPRSWPSRRGLERIGAGLRRAGSGLRLAYPTLLLSAFLLSSGLAVFVMPGLEVIYRDFGVDLPAVTRWLVDLSALPSAGRLGGPGRRSAWRFARLAGRPGEGRGSGRRVASAVPDDRPALAERGDGGVRPPAGPAGRVPPADARGAPARRPRDRRPGPERPPARAPPVRSSRAGRWPTRSPRTASSRPASTA